MSEDDFDEVLFARVAREEIDRQRLGDFENDFINLNNRFNVARDD